MIKYGQQATSTTHCHWFARKPNNLTLVPTRSEKAKETTALLVENGKNLDRMIDSEGQNREFL